jgi:hypothetical protein
MTRLVYASLLVPALSSRVEVHNVLDHQYQSFGHLSTEESLAANDALDILAKLKENSDDEFLQRQYKEIIGEVVWEEDRIFLANGVNYEEEPPMLGEPSQSGSSQKLVEMLTGRLGAMSWFNTRIGRFFTGRRDFAIEESEGETKYMIDGFTRSLHSRMQVSFPENPNPQFVVRRAFNYINPIASTVGQYVYRVIRCTEEQGGWAGGCREGEMLYTITKDRFGRGALWGQDEYRVYTGTGGCSRHGHGVLSCDSTKQILYSISSGLSSGTHDTIFYAGQIDAINGDRESGKLYNGANIDAEDMLGMQVAKVSKATGSPRALNYPGTGSRIASNAGVASAAVGYGKFAAETLDMAREQARASGQALELALDADEWLQVGIAVTQSTFEERAFGLAVVAITAPPERQQILTRSATMAIRGEQVASSFGALAYTFAWAMHIAKSLIWADSYNVAFEGGGGATDDLLVNIVAAVQDLTRENIAAGVAAPR